MPWWSYILIFGVLTWFLRGEITLFIFEKVFGGPIVEENEKGNIIRIYSKRIFHNVIKRVYPEALEDVEEFFRTGDKPGTKYIVNVCSKDTGKIFGKIVYINDGRQERFKGIL